MKESTEEKNGENIPSSAEQIDMDTWKNDPKYREQLLLERKQAMILEARRYLCTEFNKITRVYYVFRKFLRDEDKALSGAGGN